MQIKMKKKLKFPNSKISETLLDLSSPLLDALGKGATKQRFSILLYFPNPYKLELHYIFNDIIML